MDQGALVDEKKDAGARFLREFQKYLPVQVAFWVKDSEDGEWSLYIASEQITDDNFDVAYGEVVRIAAALRDPWFDPFQVKLIGSEDALAKAALEVLQRYPGRTAIYLNGRAFGGVSVEEVFIYPLPIPVPTS